MRTPAVLLVLATASLASSQDGVLLADLLDNGDFRETAEPSGDVRDRSIPWWTTSKPLERNLEGDTVWLHTGPGESASQPVCGYMPLAGQLVIRGRVRGAGSVVVLDGRHLPARFEVSGGSFEITGDQVASALAAQEEGPLRPRFKLGLVGGQEGADWTGVSFEVCLPAATQAELRDEVIAHLEFIFGLWFERGMEAGEEDTGLVHHFFDAVTGEEISTIPGGLFPLWESLLTATGLHEDPGWAARLDSFLTAYLERCIYPETGLPCRWNLAGQRAELGGWIEPHADLRFLLDVHERGPEAFRAPALEVARRMGETILSVGVLPDGNVAARYRASDGAVTLDALPLRRLDTPAQLARLGAATGDSRFLEVARNAVAEFEFTHHWPGDWLHIDPGFDDDFGIYAGRAMAMLDAYPGEATFRQLVRSGFDHYTPRWHDALRFGGTVAVDQVRCWQLMLDFAGHEPGALEDLTVTLPAALRHHLKGTQYRNGAWGDVTVAGFDPQTGIQVGDLPGAPSNLLQGIALLHDERLGMDLAEVRALYRAVLRSTDARYRRAHGYLLTEREHAGQNMAGGGLRLLAGLTEMLERLR
ncbi:MAG: hypothetical protein VYE81_05880 [Planctomycetota bacterium]|nr:hypothetical protein [Planctomycetota bacterium]